MQASQASKVFASSRPWHAILGSENATQISNRAPEASATWRQACSVARHRMCLNKTMASFAWDFQPKLDRRAVESQFTLAFAERHEDLLVTGKSSTGKSHILKALTIKACEKEWMVRYARCVDLIDDLYAGLADGS
jgi:DNA replication protein DnaC